MPKVIEKRKISPEAVAIAQAKERRESFSRAQGVIKDILETERKDGNAAGLTLGELVKRLDAYGFSEHLASQAVDATRGRTTAVSAVGRIALRDA